MNPRESKGNSMTFKGHPFNRNTCETYRKSDEIFGEFNESQRKSIEIHRQTY